MDPAKGSPWPLEEGNGGRCDLYLAFLLNFEKKIDTCVKIISALTIIISVHMRPIE